MAIEGELVVRIASRGGRVIRAAARCERPRVAQSLFARRPAREAAPLARTLFAVCGRSQSIAAQAAVDAARASRVDEAGWRARERSIVGETLQEHAWRMLVDLPRLAGQEPAVAALAEGRRILAALMDTPEDAAAPAAVIAWARKRVFGIAPEEFLAVATLEAFERWMRETPTCVAQACDALLRLEPALGACNVELLPHGEDAWVEQRLAPAIDRDAGFDAQPELDGCARETGPLARTSSHPLVQAAIRAWGRGPGARLVARLVESAQLLATPGGAGAPRHGARATGDASAISWVETARGLLVHRVALDGDRIASYRIVAPTEWNFHPEGAFTQGARTIAAADEPALEAGLRRLVASLDPCVAVRYETEHA